MNQKLLQPSPKITDAACIPRYFSIQTFLPRRTHHDAVEAMPRGRGSLEGASEWSRIAEYLKGYRHRIAVLREVWALLSVLLE